MSICVARGRSRRNGPRRSQRIGWRGCLRAHPEPVNGPREPVAHVTRRRQDPIDIAEDGAHVAIGSRWLRSDLQSQRQPLYRQLFGRIFNLMLRITLGLTFRDTQCGFKAFTRRAAQTIFPLQTVERWGFDPELLYLAKKFGFKIAEVPVAWAHSEGTRISPLRDGIRMFGEMLKIRWNALTGKYSTKRLDDLRNQ